MMQLCSSDQTIETDEDRFDRLHAKASKGVNSRKNTIKSLEVNDFLVLILQDFSLFYLEAGGGWPSYKRDYRIQVISFQTPQTAEHVMIS